MGIDEVSKPAEGLLFVAMDELYMCGREPFASDKDSGITCGGTEFELWYC